MYKNILIFTASLSLANALSAQENNRIKEFISFGNKSAQTLISEIKKRAKIAHKSRQSECNHAKQAEQARATSEKKVLDAHGKEEKHRIQEIFAQKKKDIQQQCSEEKKKVQERIKHQKKDIQARCNEQKKKLQDDCKLDNEERKGRVEAIVDAIQKARSEYKAAKTDLEKIAYIGYYLDTLHDHARNTGNKDLTASLAQELQSFEKERALLTQESSQ